jgi:hypothetical protein
MKECQRKKTRMKKSRMDRGQRVVDKAEDDMGGRRGLGKVIVYRQVKPHAARRRKSITMDCASPATAGWSCERPLPRLEPALERPQLSFTWLALYRVNVDQRTARSDVGV